MMLMKILERVLFPAILVGLGLMAAVAIFALSPKAERKEVAPNVARVEVVLAEPAARVVQVRGTGVTAPARQVQLTPEVAGRVVRVAEEAMPGGRLRKGQPLAWLDGRDYEAALAAERARLKQAELERALELQRGEAAQREWALLGANRPESQAELALRRHHLALAEANLAAVAASVERAERNVARTVISAPFDAMVVSESVEVGQVVGAGAPLANLVGTEALWVQVSVPVDRLRSIEIPAYNADQGSLAVVRQGLGEGAVLRQGRVLRLGGQLDPQTRTAMVLVEVERPLEGDGPPMLPGAHVEVEIAGRSLEAVYEIPRVAVFDGESVWVVDGEERLAKRDLSVAWRGSDRVYVTSGLAAGERVVVTPLGLPVPGMQVQATVRKAEQEG